MKILLTILIAILTTCVFAEISPRSRVAPEDFVIMPWGHAWTTNTDDDEIYREMYEMGFNVSTFMPASKLKYAKKYHLKAFIEDYRFMDNSIKDPVEKYDKWAKAMYESIDPELLDSIYQIHAQDEPSATQERLKDLSAKSAAIKKYFKVEPYINSYPNYANEKQLGQKSYQDYLDFYVQNCILSYISYDHYAFSLGIAPDIDGMTYNEGGAGFNENGFYSNLEEVRQAAIRNNVGFINIIQSVGALHWPTPDDYIIHVQGWSTLAYGAKGLSYFTLYTPNMGNWRDAPYDEYGFKSPVWRYVAHMNFAIHNIAPIYTKLKHLNVYHIGNVPKGCNDQSSAQVLKSVNLKSVNGEANALVGEFVDKDGKGYAMIVNKNPKYSLAVYEPKFAKGEKIYKVEDRSYGGQTKTFGGEDVYIMPGHGVLLYAE